MRHRGTYRKEIPGTAIEIPGFMMAVFAAKNAGYSVRDGEVHAQGAG